MQVFQKLRSYSSINLTISGLAAYLVTPNSLSADPSVAPSQSASPSEKVRSIRPNPLGLPADVALHKLWEIQISEVKFDKITPHPKEVLSSLKLLMQLQDMWNVISENHLIPETAKVERLRTARTAWWELTQKVPLFNTKDKPFTDEAFRELICSLPQKLLPGGILPIVEISQLQPQSNPNLFDFSVGFLSFVIKPTAAAATVKSCEITHIVGGQPALNMLQAHGGAFTLYRHAFFSSKLLDESRQIYADGLVRIQDEYQGVVPGQEIAWLAKTSSDPEADAPALATLIALRFAKEVFDSPEQFRTAVLEGHENLHALHQADGSVNNIRLKVVNPEDVRSANLRRGEYEEGRAYTSNLFSTGHQRALSAVVLYNYAVSKMSDTPQHSGPRAIVNVVERAIDIIYKEPIRYGLPSGAPRWRCLMQLQNLSVTDARALEQKIQGELEQSK